MALMTPPVAWNCRLYDERRTWNSLIADWEKVNGGRVPPRSSPKKLDCELAPSMLKGSDAAAPMLRPPRPLPPGWRRCRSPRCQEYEVGEVAALGGRLAIDSSETAEDMLGLVVSTIGTG
jgi:hypothetical protein